MAYATLTFDDGNTVDLRDTDVAAIQRALEQRMQMFDGIADDENVSEPERRLFKEQADHTRGLVSRIEIAEEGED